MWPPRPRAHRKSPKRVFKASAIYRPVSAKSKAETGPAWVPSPLSHRLDESQPAIPRSGCSPAEPASASPDGASVKDVRRQNVRDVPALDTLAFGDLGITNSYGAKRGCRTAGAAKRGCRTAGAAKRGLPHRRWLIASAPPRTSRCRCWYPQPTEGWRCTLKRPPNCPRR